MSIPTNLTRRGFVSGSAAVGAAACALAGAPLAALGEEAAAQPTCADEVRQHAAKLNPQADVTAPEPGATCPSLFTEWNMGALTLPNRFVKSAAGYIGVTSQGIDAPLFLDYYGDLLANSGAALVYTDDFVELYDHFKAIPDVGKIVDWIDEQLIALVDKVHAAGGRLGYQLATMG